MFLPVLLVLTSLLPAQSIGLLCLQEANSLHPAAGNNDAAGWLMERLSMALFFGEAPRVAGLFAANPVLSARKITSSRVWSLPLDPSGSLAPTATCPGCPLRPHSLSEVSIELSGIPVTVFNTQLSRSSDSPAAAKAQLDFVMARVNSTSGALILTGDLGFTPLDNGYDSLQAAGLQVRTLS